MLEKTVRFVLLMAFVLASSSLALETRAQDDAVGQCLDTCTEAEEDCVAGCDEGTAGDACATECETRSDACMDACEPVD